MAFIARHLHPDPGIDDLPSCVTHNKVNHNWEALADPSLPDDRGSNFMHGWVDIVCEEFVERTPSPSAVAV